MDLKIVAERVEVLAKEKYGNTNKMVEASDGLLNINTVYNMKKDKPSAPNIIMFQKIAELLEVTTDYLLTGNEYPTPSTFQAVNNGNNIGIVGQSNAPLTIHSDKIGENKLTEEAVGLVKIYMGLKFEERVQLLNVAIELQKHVTNGHA